MVLIGIAGFKTSGKSTCANYLVEKGYLEKSFADPLKKACIELFLLSDSQVYGTITQKETPDQRWYNCTPRQMLQFVGTDLLRDNLDKIMPGLGKDIFTHHLGIWYKDLMDKNPDAQVVISDVRFQNEVDYIHHLGGYVIMLNRDIVNLSSTGDLHASELSVSQITGIDFTIKNNSSLEELYRNLDFIIESINRL
jgi:hypothetical protein